MSEDTTPIRDGVLEIVIFQLLVWICLWAGSVSVQAADIVPTQPLSPEAYQTVVPAPVKAGEMRVSSGWERLRGVRLLPDESGSLGDADRFQGQVDLGLQKGVSILTGLTVTSEETRGDYPPFENTPQPHANGSILMRYPIWKMAQWTFTANPFFITGFSGANRFSYSNKEKWGLLMGAHYDAQRFSLHSNWGFRYRPTAKHGDYRISNSWIYSFLGKYRIRHISIFAELHSMQTAFLNLRRANDLFEYSDNLDASMGGSYRAKEWTFHASVAKSLVADPLGSYRIRYVTGASYIIPKKSQKESPREVLRRLRSRASKGKDKLLLAANGQRPTAASIRQADEEIRQYLQVREHIRRKEASRVAQPTPKPSTLDPFDRLLPLPNGVDSPFPAVKP